jgi:outer membrane protein OmpA-like peptidoglycan-associated protein
MKILIIGFLAFAGWSVLSTYVYVCKIKGLCDVPVTMQMGTINSKDIVKVDTIPKPLVKGQVIIPKNLIINFAFDKSEFNSNEETDKYFTESNAYLDQNLQARLSITGHTDATGSDKYNQALGYRRAQRMQQYFESKGILANKIIIESRGEKEPVDDNNTKTGRAKNRRTVITINK